MGRSVRRGAPSLIYPFSLIDFDNICNRLCLRIAGHPGPDLRRGREPRDKLHRRANGRRGVAAEADAAEAPLAHRVGRDERHGQRRQEGRVAAQEEQHLLRDGPLSKRSATYSISHVHCWNFVQIEKKGIYARSER